MNADNALAETRISLGKGEVESSILSRSTINPIDLFRRSKVSRFGEAQPAAERRKNPPIRSVENPWSLFGHRSPPDDISHPATAWARHPYEVR
ncbi:hypothetical protein [Sphingomonas daechungensis]|uniref:hypothetical protein n=1 Tax=Sphingomonas daechungensis TaxID=1176646 RepID=UPI00378301EB